jgi:hypothetical protein
MPMKILVAVTMLAIAFSANSCTRHKYHEPSTAADLAANVLDIASEALLKDDGGPRWDELDRRLDALFANNTKEADEAVVILVSFYLGEHECEEVDENLVSRGPRMIPLLERYRHEEPSSLLHEYPRRVKLERETSVGHLEEDLKILQSQAGVRPEEPSKADRKQIPDGFAHPSPQVYELYSWPESNSAWNFCLLPSPSGINIPVETIFDKKFRITGIDQLEQKFSLLPTGVRIIWLPGLTAGQAPNKESSKLALPPSRMVEKIKRSANQHGIQVELPSPNS